MLNPGNLFNSNVRKIGILNHASLKYHSNRIARLSCQFAKTPKQEKSVKMHLARIKEVCRSIALDKAKGIAAYDDLAKRLGEICAQRHVGRWNMSRLEKMIGEIDRRQAVDACGVRTPLQINVTLIQVNSGQGKN